MARATWSLDLPEGRHEIVVSYGYWLGKATIYVDGRVASDSRPMVAMAFYHGVDLAIEVDGHKVVVSIRPVTAGRIFVTGYRFGLSVDGRSAPGTEPVQPIAPDTGLGSRPRGGARIIEALSWASAGGAIIGLSRHGENPLAILYIAAPAACSVVTRRTSLPTWLMGLVCLVIVIAGIVTVALIGTLAR